MSITSQQYANLTMHAYGEKFGGEEGQMRHLVGKEIALEGVTYKLLEYMDSRSGYQGAIYQRVGTGQIVVAHRGTEFDREAIKDGLIADGGMVAARTNSQMADALELTQRALDRAKDPENLSRYGHTPEVTLTGHSLGGVLAQISAYKFGLRGETFNAYGAVSLGYKIPEAGTQVVNHVKASDPVSAASRHFGQVRQYASAKDVRAVGGLAGYDNDRDALDIRGPALAIGLSVGAHSMHHFTNRDGQDNPDRSILADPEAPRLAQQYGPLFERYRKDLHAAREGISDASTPVLEVHGRAREAQGRLAGAALDLSGDAVRHTTQANAQVSRTAALGAGAAAAVGLHQAAETAAGLRRAAGSIEAGIDQVQGQAQRHANAAGAEALRGLSRLLPGEQPWLDDQARQLDRAGERTYQRNAAEAADAQREAAQDATRLREGAQSLG
ncbi:MAG TPA: hypothetical protein VEY69_03180 [Lautropia sp.]|nr:hypothetical protein [Lautropia sp.]